MSLPPDGLVAALADRYVIQRELGVGGMATVYLARDIKHDREVALKVLRPDLAAVLGAERFLNEIKITARLEHPHILTLIDSGVADGALYYVVPVVRGESLRERLKKEGQLPIEDALRIASQVASALDYAHRQGVIHRDIKPENILLQEGEAMLSDFGIALALKEAGGQRLTEAGLSLGTPQYMSPEQATGDRELDARSDVYSLASVLYEMLAGDPPHMGSTMQAVVAKLVTSQPTRLRALRDTVPVGVEEAVTKALAKAPADRYTSAGSFAAALAAGAAGRRPVGRRVLVRRIAVGAIGLVLAAALGIWLARSGRLGGARQGLLLSDHLQLTSTGVEEALAISADGKQLATATRRCEATDCARTIAIADADGSGSHALLEASGPILMDWSPDHRNLLVKGEIAGRMGVYMVSTLGGAPRLVNGEGDAAFWAGGDSLLLTGPFGRNDSVFWVRVAALDGLVRDSIRVAGTAQAVLVLAVPRTPWLVVVLLDMPLSQIRVIDRQGRQIDARTINLNVFGKLAIRASTNAVWWNDGSGAGLLRIALDSRSARFSSVVDTLSGRGGLADVTADGGTLVVAQGTSLRDVYALEFKELVRGQFPPSKLVVRRSTVPEEVQISPDGDRLLMGPVNMAAFVQAEPRVYTIPFSGGPASPVAKRGKLLGFSWADSLTVYLIEQEAGKTRFVLTDARTGARRDELLVNDTLPVAVTGAMGVTPLPGGGWAWVAKDGQSIRVQRRGETAPSSIKKPDWYAQVEAVSSAPDGRLALGGDNAAGDSTVLSIVPMAGGIPVRWLTAPNTIAGNIQWLADGSIFYQAALPSGRRFIRARGPGRAEQLGRFEAPDGHLWYVSVSSDLKRVVAVRGYNRGDFWKWHVSER